MRRSAPFKKVHFRLEAIFVTSQVIYGSHADHQNLVVENLRKYYPNPDLLLVPPGISLNAFGIWICLIRTPFLTHKYSKFGPAPRTPSCMQRSYLLSIDFKVSSITEWAAQLKMNPLFAILSGFQVGDTQALGLL